MRITWQEGAPDDGRGAAGRAGQREAVHGKCAHEETHAEKGVEKKGGSGGKATGPTARQRVNASATKGAADPHQVDHTALGERHPHA
jgi:hypothetical protein